MGAGRRITVLLVIPLLAGLSLLLSVGITSCGRKQTLRIYNWADYLPQEVIEKFEKEHNCKVIYDTFASNEEMYAKIRSGGSGYDIVFPSGDHVKMMIEAGLLSEIDRTKIPNFVNIKEEVLEKMTFDPEHRFAVPYMMGTTGIVVNKKFVSTFERSWRIYERRDLAGRMTLLDDMREVFGAALKTLGYSVNSTNPSEIERAKELVLRWKENISKFDATNYAQGVVNGEFWVVHGYAENVFQLIPEEELENFEFFVPQEGATLWIDSMVILKDAKNKELAHKFIDFILRPEISAQISDLLMIPSPVKGAEEYKKVKTLYDFTDLQSCEIIDYLGDKIELYNKAWEEVIK